MRHSAELSVTCVGSMEGIARYLKQDEVVWTVDVVEEGGRFIVRTKFGEDLHDMPFTVEGFAHLYARGQRVHFQILSEIAADKPDETLKGADGSVSTSAQDAAT